MNVDVEVDVVITHWRSIVKLGGCFQQHLFVCLFVCLIVYQHSMGRWNLVARCIVQKSCQSSNLGVIGPTPDPHTLKCCILLSHYATVNKRMWVWHTVHKLSKPVNSYVIRWLHWWENQHIVSS